MLLIHSVLFFCLTSFVCGKNPVKSLTESMGQEVIEIGANSKDFPQDVDEEPSAEEDDPPANATTLKPGTKHELRKPIAQNHIPEIRRRGKDVDEIDRVDRVQREEEARIEKELAEIYKDTDYKGEESSAKPKTLKPAGSDKPILRGPGGFQLHPDHTDYDSIERWRTSVDDIYCQNKNKMSEVQKGSASLFVASCLPLIMAIVVF